MNTTETSHRNAEAFPLIAFSLDMVAEITGLSVNQLQRWDRNGFFHPSLADPNRRRPYSRIYSRDDVVVLYLIALLRQAGVPLARIRPLVPLMNRSEHGDWPALTFHVVGSRVVLSPDDFGSLAGENGRRGGPTVIAVADILDELAVAIERLRERRPEQIGQVTRTRGIMSGVPLIAGTRIPTETIAWFHSHGYSLAEILENFPRLTPTDIDAAVAFENERAAGSRELLMVHG